MIGKDIHIDNLISRLKHGDEQAFREIFDLFHKPLYYIAYKYLKDTELAEDAVQDVFLKLWVRRYLLDEKFSLRAFLFTAIKNHLLNMIRNSKIAMNKQTELTKNKVLFNNETEYSWLSAEYNTIIDAGIQKLSPQKQIIFRLHTFSGLNNAEIAQKLHISINTVKFQLSQATKFLREYLKQRADI